MNEETERLGEFLANKLEGVIKAECDSGKRKDIYIVAVNIKEELINKRVIEFYSGINFKHIGNNEKDLFFEKKGIGDLIVACTYYSEERLLRITEIKN